MPQVDRVLDVRHGSQFEQLEVAFAALGKRLTVGVEDLPRPPLWAKRREIKGRSHGAAAANRRGRRSR